MKLFELVGVKKHTKLTLTQLIKLFEKESGYKFLGGGNFAKVFKHPIKNEVIKSWVEDQAYEKYVEYCRKNSNNKYLPSIYTPVKSLSTFHKRLNGFPEKIKFVRMEMLREIKKGDIGPVVGHASMALNHMYKTFFAKKLLKIENYKKPESWGEREKVLWENTLGFWDDNKLPEDLYELYLEATKIPVEDSRIDLHYQNIMVRPSTNDLVLSDPVASDTSVENMNFYVHEAPSDEEIEDMPDAYTVRGKKPTIKV
jgi:tetrahydromethanopterin S-methyltransferase subunit G